MQRCLFQRYRAAGCISPCQRALHTSFTWASSVSPMETFWYSNPGESLCNISCTCLQMHGRNTNKQGNTVKKEALLELFHCLMRVIMHRCVSSSREMGEPAALQIYSQLRFRESLWLGACGVQIQF